MKYERLICHLCEADFGQEKKFLDHLTKQHNLVPQNEYDKIFLSGIAHLCNCGCNKVTKWGGWRVGYSKYARGHNASEDTCFTDPDVIRACSQKRSDGYKSGKYKVWNDGLTKETSEKVASMSVKISKAQQDKITSDDFVPWQKLYPDIAKQSVIKGVETKKQKFALGEIKVWNEGLTKETSEIVKQVSEKIKLTWVTRGRTIGRRLSAEEFRKKLDKLIAGKFECSIDESKYYNVKNGKFPVTCLNCKKVSEKSLYELKAVSACFHCRPRESKGQLEVFEYVKSLRDDAVLSDREVIAPYELDVYVPSAKLGIEYDGIYWHSSYVSKDENRSQKKKNMASDTGVNFISIYEDEWRDKRSIVESMIKHRLGVDMRKFNARSLSVREVPQHERKVFLENNHLEGDVRAQIAFGLYNTDELLAVVSLRKPFHEKYAASYVELARCACLKDCNVRGWLGKLSAEAFKYASKTNRKLMTYVDNRVGTGSSYKSSGWQLTVADTGPRFWWTDYYNRYNRFKYRAMQGKTQREVAEEAGVVAIYGCSNSIYTYER